MGLDQLFGDIAECKQDKLNEIRASVFAVIEAPKIKYIRRMWEFEIIVDSDWVFDSEVREVIERTVAELNNTTCYEGRRVDLDLHESNKRVRDQDSDTPFIKYSGTLTLIGFDHTGPPVLRKE